jgi:hypothetical protein
MYSCILEGTAARLKFRNNYPWGQDGEQGNMNFKDKGSIVVVALFGGAVLFLLVVPVALYALRAANNGVGIELPYVLWVVLYAVYAFGIVASASDGSLFKGSKRKGFGH